MDFVSPLRYPGGKAKVSSFVQELIIQNNLLDGKYVEPYVGGGQLHCQCFLMNVYLIYI